MQYPVDDEHSYHQVRSGSLWIWRVRTTAQIPSEKELSFPGLQQIVEIYRHKTLKRTGEISEETDLAITNLTPSQANAATLAYISRRHWAIENNLHHKRDTVLAEDTCRTRKAAQALAALRNLLLGFFHQLSTPVLRSVRSLSVEPLPLFRWLNGCI